MHTCSVKLTYEDYLLFPDDGRRHELIDGKHFMTPAPNTKHQRISRNLITTFTVFLRTHPLGEAFHAPYDIVFSEFDVCEPDVLFVSRARVAVITEQNIQGAPDLIVEILSERTRKHDEITKRKLYERYGVQEYWIVDPVLETIKVYHLTDQGYNRIAEHCREANDTLTTPLLPGLHISLDDVFK